MSCSRDRRILFILINLLLKVVAGLPDLDDHLSRLSNEDILKAMQDQSR